MARSKRGLGGFRPQDLVPHKEEPPQPPSGPSLLGVAVQAVSWGVGHMVESAKLARELEAGLLRLAEERMGILTVNDGVKELDAARSSVEKMLHALTERGCCQHGISRKGQEIYVFEEFLPRLYCCEHCDGEYAEERPECPGCGAPLHERICRPPLR